jgi:hypothetical protein
LLSLGQDLIDTGSKSFRLLLIMIEITAKVLRLFESSRYAGRDYLIPLNGVVNNKLPVLIGVRLGATSEIVMNGRI